MIRFLFFCMTFVLVASGIAQAQSPANANGQWTVTASGDSLTSPRMTMHQQGQTVLGSWGGTGTLNGKINGDNPQQVDANWNGPKGNGWATIIFSNDWKSFSGQWGFPGKKASGRFVAQRFYASYPPVTSLWAFSRTGGQTFVDGNVKLNQQGTTVVGSYNNNSGQISGTFSQPGVNEMSGTWKDKRGTGWLDLAFAANSEKLSGSWGFKGSSTASGSLVASVNTIVSPTVRGLWNVTFTGQDTHDVKLRFQQQGQSIIATFAKGRLTGTLPAGSYLMDGTWQTKIGSGPVTLTFTPEGNDFSGFWGFAGKPSSGRVLGKRIAP